MSVFKMLMGSKTHAENMPLDDEAMSEEEDAMMSEEEETFSSAQEDDDETEMSDNDGEDTTVAEEETDEGKKMVALGGKKARARARKILNSKVSENNPSLALEMAVGEEFKDLSAEQSLAVLSKSRSSPAAPAFAFRARMKGLENPKTGTGARSLDNQPVNKLARAAKMRCRSQ